MSVNAKLIVLADEIRDLSGTTAAMGLDAMANHVNDANTDIASESELIAQIIDALEGKAAGGGTTENLLDARLTNTLTAIDSDITSIVSYACYNATKITSVNLPNVTSIGSNAFRACSGIKTFYAPNTTSLGTYAFYGCNGLTELNFQNVTQAPSTCFYQCTSLTKIDFGPKCKTLAGSSLAYCSKLTHLILRYTEGVVSIATNTFSGANFDGYVYVPSASLAAYEADSSWGSYAGSRVFRAIEDYPNICGNITA